MGKRGRRCKKLGNMHGRLCAVGVRKQGDAEDIYRQLEDVARTGRLADQLAEVLKNLLPEME